MKKPHKHAELIKAWADGAEIQVFDEIGQSWWDIPNPDWYDNRHYRIKPEPKPDVVRWCWANTMLGENDNYNSNADLKLTFDGETGELKYAEVLK